MNWFAKKQGYKAILCGVYRLLNTATGWCYVGGAEDIYHRWRTHYWELTNNRSQCLKLQRSWNAHPDCWIFGILELTTPEVLREQETFWIRYYNAVDSGYNLSYDATAPMKGRKHSPKTLEGYRDRIASEAQREALLYHAKAPRSKEHRQHISNALKGRVFPNMKKPKSQRMKARLSAAKKGWVPVAAIEAAAKKKRGTYLPSSLKKKLSEIQSGKRWIYRGQETKKVNETDIVSYLEQGWKQGRPMSWKPRRPRKR